MKGKMGYKIRTITCINCGTSVTDHMREKRKYCSFKCYASSPRNDKKTGKNINCEICGCEFYVTNFRLKSGKARFCSKECADKWQRRKKDKYECKICNSEFFRSPSKRKQGVQKYCSIKCRDADPDKKEQLIAQNVNQSKKNINKLEKFSYDLLEKAGITFVKQHLINNKICVDAYIQNGNIIIQFDGDYWHGNPEKFPNPNKIQKKRMSFDKSQNAYLKKCGFTVLRFWESQIRKDPQKMIDEIIYNMKKT